ncbi:putative candidate effector 5 protein [Eutypa lata UCREL1]|uniref:Putative candidate effector 5 protein n=1 Tax=Eutypa lata (strain UCR-EL1) TaxID=1287681 RepID=M7TDG2_EUTLA|nr:putative candidate effector 5 protein [Eutypa lata UCREL1]
MFSSKLSIALFGLLGLAAAVPAANLQAETVARSDESHLVARGPDCNNLASGLTLEDCEHISSIGMANQGINPTSNNGLIWIGNDGDYTFTFTNGASNNVPVTVVIWNFPAGDYEASFMNVRQPQISYSLPTANTSVTISIARDISGGFASLQGHATTLSQWGQIYNTWGEFTTGDWATIDVSRLVNMSGNDMEITVRDNGCVSNMDQCSFWCKNNLNECGDSGTYDLVNCDNGSQPGATYGSYDGVNPDGGCQGWGANGHVDVVLRD